MINNEIKGGMIPKVNSCVRALENGVSFGFIANGTKDHSLIDTLLYPGEKGTTLRPGL